ncbi:hypothetical protein JCGZ_20292 [Jatropha curcas]|uniref:Uncharacterized protein n=1 Tax=Jatropha curcas TaxID=180498 RepID=A0A067K675_JATCU|nr:hypothetical protein JCGZ_20292 [Jatropha curcas]
MTSASPPNIEASVFAPVDSSLSDDHPHASVNSSSFPPRFRPPEPIELTSSTSRHHRSCSGLPSPLSFIPGERSSHRRATISLDCEIASPDQFFGDLKPRARQKSIVFTTVHDGRRSGDQLATLRRGPETQNSLLFALIMESLPDSQLPAGWPPVVCAGGSRFDGDDRLASCWYGKEKRECKNNERAGQVRIRRSVMYGGSAP